MFCFVILCCALLFYVLFCYCMFIVCLFYGYVLSFLGVVSHCLFYSCCVVSTLVHCSTLFAYLNLNPKTMPESHIVTCSRE